ncbi:ribosomal-protein-alanine acetyltransferase [Tetragenococcus halophilus subsp. flandriensis]|uniref:ribosomal protein S18-alanine N-acetyltransferase n=1 Tax=Tetragenococcus halophilus TaxID=51669 RepID=UPI0023E9B3DA|nr:ribosomal protein S18-alanine N-acetyltransferase [Tetragenococcus halophilus]GMA07937.1 ribosomal-protein-alanine acetyltransferase [Tetragenococcus halophilus subsp. flandriensis]
MRLINECFFSLKKLAQQLFALSSKSFAAGSPWTEEQFEAEIRNKHCGYLILEEEEIVAYLCYHQFLDEMEVFNLAIAPDEQGKGYGHLLLHHLNQIALAEQVERIILEVRVSNQAAQNLYLKNGFNQTGHRTGYYSKPLEDALVMVKKVRPEKDNERIDIRY